LWPVRLQPVLAGDPARRPALDPGWAALRPRVHVADADRCRDHFRQFGDRLSGDERPRIPANRCGGAGDRAVRPARQAGRHRRPPAGAAVAALAPGLSEKRSQGMTAQQPPRPKNGTALTVQALSKSFGDLQVLNNIDLEIPAGQFVAVVGRSGCGKSTLLRLLAGLDQASSGELLAGSTALADNRADTRLMFQDSRLLPWKKVIDNVGLGLKGDWRPKAFEALRAVGLADR